MVSPDGCLRRLSGRTHRFYTGSPVYAFGAGLSYTHFMRRLSWVSLRTASVSAHPPRVVPVLHIDAVGAPDRAIAEISAVVTNTGDRQGDEVVLLFVTPPQSLLRDAGSPSTIGPPRQQLAAFQRITLAAGETSTTSLVLRQRHLQWFPPPPPPLPASEAGMRHAAPVVRSSSGWRMYANEERRESEQLAFAVNVTY